MKILVPKPLKTWSEKQGLMMPGLKLSSKIEERFFPYMFDARLRRATPVLVYQMGKVASSSVYYSLKQIYPGVVLHAHSFKSDHDDWQNRKLYEQTVVGGKSIDIISLTREPVGRNISAFFQNFERDTGTAYRKHTYSTTELKELFLENYDHDIPLLWFDKNIKENFGIDVYEMPFPDNGIETYKRGNVRLLVMRSEIEDGAKISAIQDFLQSPDFHLIQRNIGSEKEYADEYRRFVNSIDLPPDYISRMLDSRYFKQFYGRDFAQSITQKWHSGEIPLSPNSKE